MKGTYIIVIFLKKHIQISIGALGLISFKKGYYLYIGSAMGDFGSSTLINRVKRHISPPENKKIHWHIDYFLNNQETSIVQLNLIPSRQKLECILAEELISQSDGYIKKFGSSDCNCLSHLIYHKESFFKDKK